jgi:hypothetical protein
MLKWPEKAKKAIQKLFESLQEIDIYVEDMHDEVFYRSLLNKISNDKIHIARVFELGGREAVIKAAENHDHTRRRALFIIDGDLEWVRGLPPPKIVGLHRHNAYCVENLLLCEKALAQILSQEAIIPEDDAINKIDLKGWITSIQDPLLELFAAYAIANEYAPEIQTVSKGVGNLCTTNRAKGFAFLDNRKVKNERTALIKVLEIKTGKSRIIEAYNCTLDRLKRLRFPLHAISGKDFLLPLISFLLNSHGCKIKRKSLRMRLAISGDINRFLELKNAIHSAASGFKA